MPPGQTAAPSEGNQLGTGLLPFALSHLGNPRLVKGISQAVAIWQVGKFGWETWKRFTRKPLPQIILYSNQEMFSFAMLWLPQQKLLREKANDRSFYVSDHGQGIRSSCEPVAIGQTPTRTPSAKIMPADNVTFIWNGFKVICTHERKESDAEKTYNVPDKLSLSVVGATEDTLMQLVQDIERVGREMSSTKKDPWVYVFRWDWNRVRRCARRCAILPTGQLESLIDDVRTFRDNREWYEGVGMPHRRGFLFHGLPGTGKTSTVQAVAAALEMDIYWLNPASMTDEELMNATARVGENDILLIEDVDCVKSAHNREEAENPDSTCKCTLLGLLNAIDGAVTRDGRVLFMTTNHRDKLDPALIRPGRVDVEIEFGKATHDQVLELATRFGVASARAIELATEWTAEGVVMAEVQGRLIKDHAAKGNPAGALR